jgi:tRNA(Ile)-lysidine synthetase-like protein
MEKWIKQFILDNNLNVVNKTLVVAVSTGMDSMVLLTALENIKQEFSLQLVVAHFNHHKREQSAIEQQFIESYCAKKQMKCFVGHLKSDSNGNFQANARTKRYEFLLQVCDSVKADYLVLAHHALDLVETIMMRILRGSSLHGYSGMEACFLFHNTMLIRPLLQATKQMIVDYANQNKVFFYEDYSNEEDDYTRNRIRHYLIPALEKEQPLTQQKFCEFSETLKEAYQEISKQIEAFVKQHIIIKKNKQTFLLARFLELSAFMQRELLFALLKPYELSKAQIDEIVKGLVSNKANWEIALKNEVLVMLEYEEITISPIPKQWDSMLEIKEIKTYHLNDIWTVTVEKIDEKTLINEHDIWYNSHMLPLIMRPKKTGDKIVLEGGTKKVSDLLIDRKVKLSNRKQTLVLEKDQEILAVLGLRKSVKLKEMQNCDIIIKVEKNHG